MENEWRQHRWHENSDEKRDEIDIVRFGAGGRQPDAVVARTRSNMRPGRAKKCSAFECDSPARWWYPAYQPNVCPK